MTRLRSRSIYGAVRIHLATLLSHFFLRLFQIASLLVSNLQIQALQIPEPRGTLRSSPMSPLPGSLWPTLSSPPLCSCFLQGLGRGQSLTATTSSCLPLPFSFHSRVNTSPPRAKKKGVTQPRCQRCSPACQEEERTEVKANKTPESKIPRPPLGTAAVKANTGTWRWGGGSQIKARQPWSLGLIGQARLHFQGCDGRPRRLV